MKRMVVLVGLICLLPGCAVRRNLQEDAPAAPPNAPAPVAQKTENNEADSNQKTVRIPDGSKVVIDGSGSVTISGGSLSGDSVAGDNHFITQERTAPAFHKIELDGAYDLTVNCQGAASIQVSAESNILPLIITEVQGDTLHIYTKRGVNSNYTPEICVSIPALSALTINGSGDAEISDLTGATLTLTINGSGNATIAGRVENFTADIAGSGSIDANDLIAAAANIAISGSGSAEIHADKTLNASISGSGSVTYSGDPSVNRNVSGSGSISKR